MKSGRDKAGYVIPFHFVISKWTTKINPGTLEQCLLVPPSLTAGSNVDDPNRNAQHAQIHIYYHLRMMAKYRIPACTEPSTISTLEPVTVLPFTEVQPPMNTQDFPTEFVESLSGVIRTSLFGPTLGTLTVSTQEPPALVYNDFPFSGSSTALEFKIELDAAENNETYQRLRRLIFDIDGVIRIKTFFSATPFPYLPSQTLLTSQGKIRLLDNVVRLKPQSTGGSHWQYLRGAEQSRWRTMISMPIHVKTRLSPTFCSSLVARFYTLVIRLKVLNACNRKLSSWKFRFKLSTTNRIPSKPLQGGPGLPLKVELLTW